MALTYSTGFANYIASGGSWSSALKNGIMQVYGGTKPTSADTGATATLLCEISANNGTYTSERRAICRVVLAGGSGDVNMKVNGISITGGAVDFNGTLAQTKADVVTAINSNPNNYGFYAVAAGEAIGGITFGTAANGEFFVLAPKNSGQDFDTATVLFANTTMTADINNAGTPTTTETGAFASATNGSTGGSSVGDGTGRVAVTCLEMTFPAVAGLISKSGTWSDGSANAGGTATWFRFLCNPCYDSGTQTLATTGHDASQVMRLDGTIGTSGTDAIITNPTIVIATSQTVNQFDLTIS